MDAELRELQRAWLASQDSADEERYLTARKRVEALPRSSLLVATWAGDQVAYRLLGPGEFLRAVALRRIN